MGPGVGSFLFSKTDYGDLSQEEYNGQWTLPVLQDRSVSNERIRFPVIALLVVLVLVGRSKRGSHSGKDRPPSSTPFI